MGATTADGSLFASQSALVCGLRASSFIDLHTVSYERSNRTE